MNGKLYVVPGGSNKTFVMVSRILSEESEAKLNRLFYEEVPLEKRVKKRGDWNPKPMLQNLAGADN